MKVLLVGRPFSGMRGAGVERYASDLVEGLRRAGVEFEHTGSARFVSALSRYVPPNRSPIGPPLYDFVVPVLLSLTRGWRRYDVVHLLDIPPGLFWPILRRTAKRSVVTVHHLGPAGVTRGSTVLTRFWSTLYDKSAVTAFREADVIIADSSTTAAEIESRHGLAGKIVVIHPGVGEKFRPVTGVEGKFRGGNIVLGYVGARVEWKRVDSALEIVALLQSEVSGRLSFLVAGTGPARDHLFTRARQLGVLDIVKFLGHVPDTRLPAFYSEVDILLVPSLYEGFGYTIIEAQASGTPVLISSNAGIPPEVGRCAIHYSSVEDAARKTISLLRDRTSYERIRNEGIEFARTFSLDSTLLEILRAYGRLGPT